MITQEIIKAMHKNMRQDLIKLLTATELRAVVQPFRDKWHFPQVAGAKDSTHTVILAPCDTPADYYNCKSFFSVLLQCAVDYCFGT